MVSHGGPQNYSFWSNPKFNALADQIDREVDPAKRQVLIRQAEAIIEQDPPVLPCRWEQIIDVWCNYVKVSIRTTTSASTMWCARIYSGSTSRHTGSGLAATRATRPLHVRHLPLGCHSPSAAPVGSMMMDNEPAPITSITSLTMVAPSDFALAVAAAMSSTST